jgi:Spy/CpxP family protein refolding chaperone
MKRTLMTLALAGSLVMGMNAAPLFAQDSAPPPPMQQGMGGMHHGMHGRMHHRMMTPDQQLAHMTKMLDLTADQQAKLKPILEARDQKMREIWKEHAQQMKQMREQMMTANKDSKAQVDAVLTPEQKQKMDEMMQRRMERMHQRWHQGRGMQPPPPPAPPTQPQ